MSRLLSHAEIEALLASGPMVPAPTERLRIVIEAGRAEIPFGALPSLTPGTLLPLDGAPGDPVQVVANGTTIAHGHLVASEGRLCVRIETLAKPGSAVERDPR
ncbi:MAG: hypothetical protein E6K76_00905 [Candidatus Eisenbacteria bacterium]|uniref:Flagellar motor switch protein FliN-like C-terminal domain-containing protein n=1 Tax=Eiseniibacteriota bacterium TaxID=2212470 RepID=A0A538TAM0_UNCEI|nr:MAG: hypothetical protein E6K76_00905 [Candidatus Eisenbacteria bacterium]